MALHRSITAPAGYVIEATARIGYLLLTYWHAVTLNETLL